MASYLPNGATLTTGGTNPATAVFAWTPTIYDTDYYEMIFFAVDQLGGLSDPLYINIAVKGTGDNRERKRKRNNNKINRCLLLCMGRPALRHV
jgi:hypothetical protein